MPELTVSMPAFNTAKYIADAIQSVLNQQGVDFELIVVDDGSTDDTASIVQSFDDPRIHILCNECNRGISYCHNRVIELSDSPFLMIVDSDDVVAQGAFCKMLEKIQSSPKIGQVHCNYYDMNGEGKATNQSFESRRRQFRSRSRMNYRRELLIHGSLMNHLRTYRREVFEKVGVFNEELAVGEDLEMALRLLEHWEIALVPEFLYYRRLHDTNTSQSKRFLSWRFWFQRVAIIQRLIKDQQVHYVTRRKAYWLLLLGFVYISQIPAAYYAIKRIQSQNGSLKRMVWTRLIQPIGELLYALAQRAFAWWPLGWFGSGRKKREYDGKRVGYYFWRFPTLSEIFIRREIVALLDRGFDVRIIADEPVDLDVLDQEGESLLKLTRYLYPEDTKRFNTFRRQFLRRNPFRYLNLALYVVFHQYGAYKTFSLDRELFRKVLYLAGVLEEEKINFLHSPWADQSAFVAMVASRFIGIPHSIQVRAFEIHRNTHAFALREKFKNASFVVTDCEYNRNQVLTYLKEKDGVGVHAIYEGIDPNKIRTQRTSWSLSGPIRILCVSRLVEKKGLDYLLRACKLLQARGVDFRCDIIGAPNMLYADYYVRLIKLYRELDLQQRVYFQGAQPFARVMDAFQNADLFVLPCVISIDGDRDIVPNVLIEAMANKLPVISTAISGVPEIIEDRVSGILVLPGDEQVLCDAIQELARDEELRRKLGEEGRRRILERFDITRNISRYADLFETAFKVNG